MIYDRDGHLVASTAQEGLIRVVHADEDKNARVVQDEKK
jgi:hypothetical protein